MLAPSIDLQLLELVNRPGVHALDLLMQAASHRGVLAAVAAIAALYLWRRSPHGLLAAVLLVAAIGAADLISVRLVKPAAARVRPCQERPSASAAPFGCGAGASFPSAHAADAAAAATVFAWALPAASAVGIFAALLIGLSRVYLGVHWPSDVAFGWLLGAAVGTALLALARLRFAVRAD